MEGALIQSLLISLTLTLLLELAFSLLWGVRGKALALVGLMNVMTNPAAVTAYFCLCLLGNWQPWQATILIEVLVVAAEGFCARNWIDRPWLFAAAVNGFSYSVGLLLQLL